MNAIELATKSLVAPRVKITYVDSKGQESDRELIITEVRTNLITGLDTSSNDTGKRWHIRSFRADRIKNFTVL